MHVAFLRTRHKLTKQYIQYVARVTKTYQLYDPPSSHE